MRDNKVNSKMLKDLIKEVLGEQKLEEKNSFGKYDGTSTWDRKQAIGLPRSNAHPTDAKLKDLVKLDSPSDMELDDADLIQATPSANPDEYATAKKWFARSSKAPSGFADEDASKEEER